MSVIGKKLNPIQSSGGGNSAVSHNNDDDSSGNNQSTQSITPDDVLSLTKIAEEYMCSPGTRHSSTITICYVSMSLWSPVNTCTNVSATFVWAVLLCSTFRFAPMILFINT